jgi:hypothetical protein
MRICFASLIALLILDAAATAAEKEDAVKREGGLADRT